VAQCFGSPLRYALLQTVAYLILSYLTEAHALPTVSTSNTYQTSCWTDADLPVTPAASASLLRQILSAAIPGLYGQLEHENAFSFPLYIDPTVHAAMAL